MGPRVGEVAIGDRNDGRRPRRRGRPALSRRELIRRLAVATAAGIVAGAGIREARSRTSPAPAGSQGGPPFMPAEIDWRNLIAANRDTVGWIGVHGTPIKGAVVHPRGAGEEDFYLTHGIDRAPSLEGTPYLDIRSEPTGRHLLIFGHHVIIDRNAQFSPVYRAFEQEVFDGIGRALWLSPQAPPAVFQPLMALRVTETFAPVQRFRFEGDEDVRSWLQDLFDQADSRAAGGSERIGGFTRALTLCTCSGERVGGVERTLMMFAR